MSQLLGYEFVKPLDPSLEGQTIDKTYVIFKFQGSSQDYVWSLRKMTDLNKSIAMF